MDVLEHVDGLIIGVAVYLEHGQVMPRARNREGLHPETCHPILILHHSHYTRSHRRGVAWRALACSDALASCPREAREAR